MRSALSREWLEADGLGGFASGTVDGARTRRYHAVLLTARTPPTGRVVLVNGFDAWVETPAGRFALSSQVYAGDVTYPDGATRLDSFELEPWPRWTFVLEDGARLVQELVVPKGASAAAVSWRVLSGNGPIALEVRPFLSGRDYHALHHENRDLRFDAESVSEGDIVRDLPTVIPSESEIADHRRQTPGSRQRRAKPARSSRRRTVLSPGRRIRFRTYPSMPSVTMRFNGNWTAAPEWYRNFLYAEERARGLDFSEDLAAPGILRFDLSRGEAIWLMAAEGHEKALGTGGVQATADTLRTGERSRRERLGDRLDRAADAYLVRRGDGGTIVAGYPWFTDWGRDTFLALRGLCLATGRLAEAGAILGEWAGAVSRGMLPNLFPDAGSLPEFNSVDASLWYVVAVHDYLEAMREAGLAPARGVAQKLQDAVAAILDGYAGGTRYGIRADTDGLLAAGEPGMQLTWMDAKFGDRVVTPRVGKPVEVQALWLNALRIGGAFSPRWHGLHDRALESFSGRFWNAGGGYLQDVVDPDHRPGTADPTFRPNQVLAVGGLPFPVLEGERARQVVDAVEARLVTPLGLRTLPPDDPNYHPHYEGSVGERDGAYHQGTAWPWLTGAFADAWVRVRGGGESARREARRRFLDPLFLHLEEAGLGHVSEIADGDAPHTVRGCPFQAWSVGEMLRMDRVLLAASPTSRPPARAQRSRVRA